VRWLLLMAAVAVGSTSVRAQAQVPTPQAAAPGPTYPPPPPLVLEPPTLGMEPARLPLSMRLIEIRGPSAWGTFTFDRGGVTVVNSRYVTGLDLAVAGSDRAVALAREAHGDLVTGAAFTWSGLGVIVLSALAEGVAVSALAPSSGSSSDGVLEGTLIAGSVGVLVGAILIVVGAPYTLSGNQKALDAANAYNGDLVDGRLRAPTSFALPGA